MSSVVVPLAPGRIVCELHGGLLESKIMNITKPSPFTLHYLTLRSVTSPEDQEAERKRYCGVAKADQFFELSWEENVRAYLGVDEEGRKRKSTLVNKAIRDTIESRRDLFPMLNSGLVVVAKSVVVDDNSRQAKLQ